MKIAWHYDLLYIGGIETSLCNLFEQFKKMGIKHKMYMIHRQQYFTQDITINRLKKYVELVNINDIDKIDVDIVIYAGMIFPYEDMKKINAKKRIGWIHFVPGEQVVTENMLLYKQYYETIDEWVCVSETSKKGLEKFIKDKPIYVIHNSIDSEEIKRLAEEPIDLDADADTLKMVTCTRLAPDKRNRARNTIM